MTLENATGKIRTLGIGWLKKSNLEVGGFAQIDPARKLLWDLCLLDTWTPDARYRIKKIQYTAYIHLGPMEF